ncbi:MAG: OsmC family protein [Acidimicrobiales bacterium]
MDDASYEVEVSAGSLRPAAGGVVMPHRWTSEGVVVEADFTGAHLYHLAAAGCVLNDLYREAERTGIRIDGAWVRATAGFDPATWASTGIDYEVDVASDASDEEIERLVWVVDDVAEIPKALRSGTTVARKGLR